MSGSHLYYQAPNGEFVPVSASAPLPVEQTTTELELTIDDVTADGEVSAGSRWVSVTNTGEADGTFAGATLAAGATETIAAPSGTALGAIAYDATGTTLRIRTLATATAP